MTPEQRKVWEEEFEKEWNKYWHYTGMLHQCHDIVKAKALQFWLSRAEKDLEIMDKQQGMLDLAASRINKAEREVGRLRD